MLRTEVWAGVQLSKLSAEVHEYEGGLEGARPCVGPQAYVVIVLIVGGGPCGLARIAIGMRQLGYGRVVVVESCAEAVDDCGAGLTPTASTAAGCAPLIERIGLLT